MIMTYHRRLTAFAGLVALILGICGPARAQRLDYAGCVAACEAAFPNVVASEKTCVQTVTAISGELPGLKGFLTGYRCKGRHRKECETWKSIAVEALSQLVQLTSDSSDCRILNSTAIEGWIHIFDTSRACRGDAEVTDFHDLVGKHEDRIGQLNSTARGYTFTLQQMDTSGEYGAHMALCGPGQRPRRYYIWPLLEFNIALEALGQWQSCVSRCKKPTPEQAQLWEIEDRLTALKNELATLVALSDGYRTRREEAARKEVSGVRFPAGCRALFKLRENLTAAQARVDAVSGALARLGVEESYSETIAQELKQQLSDAEAVLSPVTFDAVETACVEEDSESAKLESARRRLLEELLRSESICLKAAGVFDVATSEGEKCEWIGDCSIPLFCKEGLCSGVISVDEVALLLQKARKLRDDGLALELRDEQGLVADSGVFVKRLQTNFESLAAQLDKRGWGKSVGRWKEQFTGELEERMSALEQRIESLASGLADENTRVWAEATLQRLGRGVDRAKTEAERVRQALGQADPVEEPNWLRIRLKDLRNLEGEVKDLENEWAKAADAAAVGQGGGVVLFAVGGAVVLLLVLVSGFLFFRVRRRKRRSGPDSF